MTTVRVLLLHHELNKNTYNWKNSCQHFSILHVSWTCVQCVRRSVVLRTPYNDTIH